MGKRIVIKVRGSGPDGIPSELVDYVATTGASDLRHPHPELPDIVTLVLREDADEEGEIERIRSLPDVLDAEADTIASTQ
jgi:hypothetical protein